MNVSIVFSVVLVACLFGILTRPYGSLAAFWPANAVLLGLFVRHPPLVSPAGWFAAIAGYFTADILTGGSLLLTIWLTAGNLAGVGVGVLLYARINDAHRTLGQPSSVLYLLGVLSCAAAGSAVVGAGVAPVFFGRDWVSGLAFWFTTELVNGIIVLPVILTAPAGPFISALDLRRGGKDKAAFLTGAPIVALALSLVVGHLVGGMGALAFPSPALLWCALVYPLFPTVLLTMLVSISHLIAVSLGVVGEPAGHIDAMTMTDRLSIMLLALGPLTVASINAARVELTSTLTRLATYDALTGALTRAAFSAQASSVLSARPGPLAVMTIDIDHFKRINDTHGHAAGDRALAAFADVVGRALRKDDLFGRIGGEEFAILTPAVSDQGAKGIADRLRAEIEDLSCALPSGDMLRFTVSVGFVHVQGNTQLSLENLLAAADDALYRAKGAGRNQVVAA
ncbi:diguanylate cyclase [Ancylobacter sonchi]|uniref:GGDEF domain-containing protein n=1 Tax=Ancylobacter TaxID=99 RepID=UPI001BD34E86|nr:MULTISPECIES: GGDEF domain-containing protein [Ancylobacter]MBS7536762.1 diguanylate cyclase [Ancylobacter sonchi]MCB4770499.1 diguanylate cyclase [Ancylobacter sp. Lp-2]